MTTVTLKLTATSDEVRRETARVVSELGKLGPSASRAGSQAAAGMSQAERAARDLGRGVSAIGAGMPKAVSDVTRGASSIREQFKELKSFAAGALGVGIGLASIRQVALLSDEYTNYISKLRLVSDGEAGLAEAKARTLDIAQRTRTDLASTGELYARLSRATENLNLVESQRLQITETINKALTVSGATAQEASAAIIQLSQGLAAGALRGEEFNSVAEQAPILLDLLSKSLGVGRGELRAMAKEGALTAEVITGALLEGASSVDAQFEQMGLTIGGATTQLKNAFQVIVGEGGQASGAAGALALAISGLATALPAVLTGLTAVGAALASRYIAGLITSATATVQMTQVTAALAAMELREAQATEAAALADLNRTRIVNVKTGAIVVATGAEQAYALAQARTAAATVAANGANALALTGFAKLRAGLLSFVGDGLGAAILGFGAAALALKALHDAAKDMEARGQGLADSAEVAAASTGRMAAALRSGAESAPDLATALGQLEGNASQLSSINQQLAEREEVLNQTWIVQTDEIKRVFAEAETLTAQKASLRAASEDLANAILSDLNPALGELVTALAQVAGFSTASLLAGIQRFVPGAQALIEQSIAAAKALSAAEGESTAAIKKATEAAQLRGKSLEEVARIQGEATLDALRAQGVTEAQLAGEKERIETLAKLAAGEDTFKNRSQAATAARKAASLAQRESNKLQKEAQDLAEELQDIRDENFDVNAQENERLNKALKDSSAALADIIQQEERRFALAGLSAEEYDRMVNHFEKQDALAQAVVGLSKEQVASLVIQNALKAAGLAIDEAQTAELDAQLQRRREQARGLFGTGGAGTEADPFTALNTLGDLIGEGIVQGFSRGSAGLKSVLDNFVRDFGSLTGAEKTEVVADTITSIANVGQRFLELRDSMGGFDAALHAATEAAASGAFGPEAQAVARAVQAIDGLFGGRLLGTAFEVERTGRSFGIGAGGVTGSTFTTESRQRSFFRGTQRRTDTDPLDQGTQEALEDFLRGMQSAVAQAARALGATAPALIAGSFAETFDADGELISQIGTIAGRVFRESAENFQRRLTAENLIAVVGALDDTASQIAERWRDNARELLEGAQLLLAAQASINSGQGLLGIGASLAATVDIVEELAFAGEPLSDAFTRILTATTIYTEALDVMGIRMDQSREDIVRMAAAFAEFAGGIEAAATKLQTFFEYFYSPEELAAGNVERTSAARGAALSGLGLSSDLTDEAFRLMFEASFASATPEIQARWLDAAVAVAAAGTAQERYNTIIEEAAEVVAEAARELSAFMRRIDDDLASLDGLSLAEQFARISREMQENILTATALGATEAQLNRIRLLSARQAQALIDAENRNAASLVERLGYSIEVGAGLGTVADGIDAVGAAIASFRDNMLLDSNLSPLSVQGQYEEALRQLSQTGDESTGRRALELARMLKKSGQDYNDAFALITSLVRPQSAGNTGQNVAANAASVQQTQAQRLQDAQALAQSVASLALVQERSFESIAEQLGFSLEQLVTDLGLGGLTELTDYLTSLQTDPATNIITAGESRMIELLEAIAGIRRLDPTTGKPTGASRPGFDVIEAPYDPGTQVPTPVVVLPTTPLPGGPTRPPGGGPVPGDPERPIHVDGIGTVATAVGVVGAAVAAQERSVVDLLETVAELLTAIRNNTRGTPTAPSGSRNQVHEVPV